MSFDERSLKLRPVNSREQDLFLMAKGHYNGETGYRRAEHARRLVAIHNGVRLEHMRWGDALYVVLNDLAPVLMPGMTERSFCSFLMDLVPHPVSLLGPDFAQDGGVCAVIIDRVFSEVSATQVIDDAGQWCMPFPRTEPDPAVKEALELPVDVPQAA